MEKIYGITHPVPKEFAERIYDGKNVYVGKSFLKSAKKGDKFILYESHGAGAFTGWADIVNIDSMSVSDILEDYENDLMLTSDELKDYAGKKKIVVIEFNNFKKFDKPIKPKHFVSMRGKYINKAEFDLLSKS